MYTKMLVLMEDENDSSDYCAVTTSAQRVVPACLDASAEEVTGASTFIFVHSPTLDSTTPSRTHRGAAVGLQHMRCCGDSSIPGNSARYG